MVSGARAIQNLCTVLRYYASKVKGFYLLTVVTTYWLQLSILNFWQSTEYVYVDTPQIFKALVDILAKWSYLALYRIWHYHKYTNMFLFLVLFYKALILKLYSRYPTVNWNKITYEKNSNFLFLIYDGFSECWCWLKVKQHIDFE